MVSKTWQLLAKGRFVKMHKRILMNLFEKVTESYILTWRITYAIMVAAKDDMLNGKGVRRTTEWFKVQILDRPPLFILLPPNIKHGRSL